MRSSGKVYLVGAGVQNRGTLTQQALNLLKQAEVLIYDALVEDDLLQYVPPQCEVIDVGKRGGKPSTPQGEINQLLVKYCQKGKQVIRLKSGDPLIFGRAREEVEALQAAHCAFEIVPGLSSALAAPALAGIPLTDKHLSGCFAVLSAHAPHTLNWQALAQIDTLVLLMGGRNLPQIVEQLKNQGKFPSHPVAIIQNGGSPNQQTWVGTLADIVEKTAGVALSPCIIVVGEVVSLQNTFQSPQSSPLAGKTVLVTRSAEQASIFSTLLEQQGARVMEMPTLEITPPSSWEGLDQAIAQLPQFDWLILTSANGVEFFFNRLATLEQDIRCLAGVKIAVVGKKTAKFLQKRGLQPDFIPPNFVADALVEHFPESLAKKKILFPRVETGGRTVLVEELSHQGAEITEVAAYESGCPATIDLTALSALQQGKIDVITFASSKTVRYFEQLLSQAVGLETVSPLLKNLCLASIGPQTSQTCEELFQRVDVEAVEFTLEGLTEAIVNWANPEKP
ncbi:uroporphyrinogen-III C-methyltransferase [Spirulina subsalsa]|uniref:uroporphyrinogen-III C-methyltransferase n=1 Tax=Spirulina subsalsa TaxID=54311 RepID=UPI0002F51C2C|nr:uroporphyrinogen-III C-methyltransferase [Spirulina subsalsa]